MEFYCRYKSSRKRTGTNARLGTSLVIATGNLIVAYLKPVSDRNEIGFRGTL